MTDPPRARPVAPGSAEDLEPLLDTTPETPADASESRPPGASPLSRRAARTLYNAADAWFPPGPDGAAGGGDVDVAPAVARELLHRGPGAARRVGVLLTCLEWQPLLTFRARRGFSHLPREERRALLAGWERSRLGPRRRAVQALRERVARALAAARPHSSEGA